MSEGEVEGLDLSMDSAASTDDGLDSAQRMREVMEQERKAIVGTVSSVDELDETNASSGSSSIDENHWRDRALAKVWAEKPKMTASEACKLADLAHRGRRELDDDRDRWLMRAASAVRARRAHDLRRQLSPGEIAEPALSTSCEAFAQIADQVDQLPELISQDVHGIRERFLRRPVELQSSLSTSELDYVETYERHQHFGCRSSSDTNVLDFEYGDRVPSMDSFIYVFLSRARSLDDAAFQDGDEQRGRKGAISRPKSVPLCHKENDRLEAEQFDLPVREISASLEYLPLPKLETKQRSSSLGYSGENAHLLDIPPDRIFGGAPDEHAIARESLAANARRGSQLREAQTQTDAVGRDDRTAQSMARSVSFGDVLILPECSFDSEVRSSESEPTIGNGRGRSSVRSPRVCGVDVGIQASFEELGFSTSFVRSEAETQTSGSTVPGMNDALETVRRPDVAEASDRSYSAAPVEMVDTEMAVGGLSSDVMSSSSPEGIDTTLLRSIRRAKEILETALRPRRMSSKARRKQYYSDDGSSSAEEEERSRKRRRRISGGRHSRDQTTFISLDVITQTGSSLTNLTRTSSEPNLANAQVPDQEATERVIRAVERHVPCLERWSSACFASSGHEVNSLQSQNEADLGRRVLDEVVSDFLRRSIETQTYQNQQVTGTQTADEVTTEMPNAIRVSRGVRSLATPIMIDTGVGASPPQCSPVLLSPFYDVAPFSARSPHFSSANQGGLAGDVPTDDKELAVGEVTPSQSDSTNSEAVDVTVLRQHRPDLHILQEEREESPGVGQARAVDDTTISGSLDAQQKDNIHDLAPDDDRVKEVDVPSKQNQLEQTETDVQLECSSIVQEVTTVGRDSSGEMSSLDSGEPQASILEAVDPLADAIKDINYVLSSQISRVLSDDFMTPELTAAEGLEKQERLERPSFHDGREYVNITGGAGAASVRDEFGRSVQSPPTENSRLDPVPVSGDERTAPPSLVPADGSSRSAEPGNIVSTLAEPEHRQIYAIRPSEAEGIISAGDQCLLEVAASEDTASESSGNTTGSEVTVIEGKLQEEYRPSPGVSVEEDQPASEVRERRSDETATTEAMPVLSGLMTCSVRDFSTSADDSRGALLAAASESANTDTRMEDAGAVPALHLGGVSVVPSVPAKDVTADAKRPPTALPSVSSVMVTDAQQMASLSEDTRTFSGRTQWSVDVMSAESLHVGRPPSRAAATQYDDQIYSSLARGNQRSHAAPTHYPPSDVDHRDARNVQNLALPRDRPSPKTADDDSDIQQIVEKYQKYKDLIEKGAIDEEEGIPLVTRQDDQMTSMPSLRKDADLQIHISVSAHCPADVMDHRPQSAPPTPTKTDTSTSTAADAAPSPNSTMVDEAVETESVNTEYDDELERLRKERQRILVMLAKDQMPSKLQVELAEAQLNYLIGQTDTLLNALEEPLWDTSSIIALSAPERQLSEISRRYLARYRETLQRSRLEIESRISQLEKKQQEKVRSRQRSRHYMRVMRDAEREAFLRERRLEEVRHRTVVRLPHSKSASPGRGQRPSRSASPESGRGVPLPPPPPTSAPLGAEFLRPKQRISYLAEKRRDLVESTHRFDLDRSRSMSPALSIGSSASSLAVSPRSYSTGTKQQQQPQHRHLHQLSSSSSVLSSRQLDPVAGHAHGTEDRGTRQWHDDDFPYLASERFDVASISSSLDEETHRLLVDYQSARGQTQVEIQMAKESLNRRPVSKPRPRSPSTVCHVSQALLSSASGLESRIDPDLEKKIDQEIEELKTRCCQVSPESLGEHPQLSRHPRTTPIRSGPVSSTLQTSSLYDPLQSSFSERDLLLMTGKPLPYSHSIHDSHWRYDPALPHASVAGYSSVLKKTRPIRAADIKAQILHERTFAHSLGKHKF